MYECNICGKKFEKRKSMGGHKSSAHGKKIGQLHPGSDRMKVSNVDDDMFRNLVKNSRSFTDICKELKLIHNYAIKERIEKLLIDTSHWEPLQSRGGKRKIPANELLIKGRKQNNKETTRRALKEIGREYRCETCPIVDEWNGKSLRLQIHHIDGDNLNNEPSNLQFLCPNCHTQTHNWGSKKNRK